MVQNPSNDPAIADLVIADMESRKRLGGERYGKPLTVASVTEDSRDPLRELYEELQDSTVYVRWAMIERARLLAELAEQKRINLLLAERVQICSELLGKKAERKNCWRGKRLLQSCADTD